MCPHPNTSTATLGASRPFVDPIVARMVDYQFRYHQARYLWELEPTGVLYRKRSAGATSEPRRPTRPIPAMSWKLEVFEDDAVAVLTWSEG